MLRYPLLPCQLNCVDRTKEPSEPTPRYPRAEIVEFAKGGDLTAAVEKVRVSKRIEIHAAMGAGKSSRVPVKLAEQLGRLVVQTIPYAVAAQAMCEYVRGAFGEQSACYVGDVETELPKAGVVYMSSACFQARRLHDNFAGVDPFILYVDESHESDGWTAYLRDAALSLSVVEKVCYASATFNPGERIPVRTEGQHQVVKYPYTKTTSWSALDKNKPWSISNIDSHLFLFLERESTIKRMAADYLANGFKVRYMNAKTTYDDYKETMRLVGDQSVGIVVVFASYVARSSLSILGTWLSVESGEVAFANVGQAGPFIDYRQAYQFEVDQAARRFARVRGASSKHCIPDIMFENKMCDVDALEADAAALCYRMAGHRPPMHLMDFPMAQGDVPKDIVSALAGEWPLRVFPAEARESWVTGQKPPETTADVGPVFEMPSKVTMARHVSCRTIPETPGLRSPLPAMPALDRIVELDSDALSKHAPTRPVSPILPVLRSCEQEQDNATLLANHPERMFLRPKRRSNQSLRSTATSDSDDEPMPQPVALRSRDTMMSMKDTTAVVGKVGEKLAATQKSASTVLMEQGVYYFHPAVAEAPDHSAVFYRGYVSVVQFSEQHVNAVSRAKLLPASERAYATKKIVDKYNHATATMVAVRRLMDEIARRPPESFKYLRRVEKLQEALEWVTNVSVEAEIELCEARQLLPLFVDGRVYSMNPAESLENKIMGDLMAKFDDAMATFSGNCIDDYLKSLNARRVKVGPRITGHARMKTLE